MSDTSWMRGVDLASGRASPQGLSREQRLAHERMAALPRRVHLRLPPRDHFKELGRIGNAARQLLPKSRGVAVPAMRGSKR
jgi:hypothetical protein